MKQAPGQSALSYYLGCTMYFAAALESTNPTQREQLRAAVQPFIESRSPELIPDAVDLIMGSAWRPAEKWRGFWSEAWTR